MRPQWRSTGVPSHQLGTNIAQSHNLHSSQQLHPNQSQILHSPRQHSSPGTFSHHQHASPGNLQQQRQSPGINLHSQHASPGTSHQQHSSPGTISHQHHAGHGSSQQQRPSPGINSQQRPGVWVNTNRGQWLSTSSANQAQALGGAAAAASEQSWRPAQRMRGSVPNPSLGTSPSALQQQRASAANAAFPSTQTHGYNTAATNASSVSVPRFQVGIPVRNSQAANNVSLYNGTTWVNAPDFSSTPPAPLFANVPAPDGWMTLEDLDLPELPQ